MLSTLPGQGKGEWGGMGMVFTVGRDADEDAGCSGKDQAKVPGHILYCANHTSRGFRLRSVPGPDMRSQERSLLLP